jgi:uncharacterized protein with HEPN domain
MREAADTIIAYTTRGREAFDGDAAGRDTMLYQIVVLGEAAKAKLATDPSIASALPEVEWSPIACMRDRVAHHYWATDRVVVWATATVAVPEPRAALAAALARLASHEIDATSRATSFREKPGAAAPPPSAVGRLRSSATTRRIAPRNITPRANWRTGRDVTSGTISPTRQATQATLRGDRLVFGPGSALLLAPNDPAHRTHAGLSPLMRRQESPCSE